MVNEIEYTLNFSLCAHYKVCNCMMITDFYNKYNYVQFLLIMMGMKSANYNYAC